MRFEERKIQPEDLEVEMEVAIPVNISYGWNQRTGLTQYRFRKITKITPARRKVFCEDEEYEVKNTPFLLPCKEMEEENRRAFAFAKMVKALRVIQSPIPFIGTVEEMERWAAMFEALQKHAEEKEKEK